MNIISNKLNWYQFCNEIAEFDGNKKNNYKFFVELLIAILCLLNDKIIVLQTINY